MLSFRSLRGLWRWADEPAYRFPKVGNWPFNNQEPHIGYMVMIHDLIHADGAHTLMPETSGTVGIRNARRYIWWASGRLYPSTNPGINNTCGERRCISWNHLALATPAEQYAYQCDMHCGGYHLTSIKPSKYKPKKVGAW